VPGEVSNSIESIECNELSAEVPTVTPLAVRAFFLELQHRSTSLQHHARLRPQNVLPLTYRDGVLVETPLRRLTMRTPKTLPDVPTKDELRARSQCAPTTLSV